MLRVLATLFALIALIFVTGCSGGTSIPTSEPPHTSTTQAITTEVTTPVKPTKMLGLSYGAKLSIATPDGWSASILTDSLADKNNAAAWVTDHPEDGVTTGRKVSAFANMGEPDARNWKPSWVISGVMLAGTACKGLPPDSQLQSDPAWSRIGKWWANETEYETRGSASNPYYTASRYAMQTTGTGADCRAVIAQSMESAPDKSSMTGQAHLILQRIMDGTIGEVTFT